MIQIPLTINAKEIERAIFSSVNHPLSSGITKKITADIFATEKISREDLIEKYKDTSSRWFNPIEATYKYISKDVTRIIDRTFEVGMWVKHRVYLKDISILFEGSKVKILTSYTIDVILDYEQNVIPSTEAYKVKGLLKGILEANVNLVGTIFINDKAQLEIRASQDDTKVEFTKIELPTAVNHLDILKVTKMEDFLTKKLLEEPVNKYIFNQVQKNISKRQVDIKLAQRIQKLVYDNSNPLPLSKDVWLIPQANKISISQLGTKNGVCSNTLSINVGLVAQPKLITSITKPLLNTEKNIPIVCERLEPQIHLYPSLNIKYSFVEDMIEKDLRFFINTKYPNAKHSITNVRIYPNNEKLVLAIDLLDKTTRTKIVTFYLWGDPKLDHETMSISLENFEYTLESKNYLFKIAQWMLDEKIKKFIQQRAIFSYKDEFLKLSEQLSTIEHTSGTKIISGGLNLVGIENVFLSKDSLVIHALATGNLSYKINLRK